MEAFTGIQKYYNDRGWTTFNPMKEFLKLEEVLMEFFEGHTDENEQHMVESLCETIAVSVSALANMGYDPEKVLDQYVAHELSIEGCIEPHTNKWRKNINQQVSTINVPDFQACRKV